MENAIKAISVADTLIVGGTSLAVYPAAGQLQVLLAGKRWWSSTTAHPADGMANLIFKRANRPGIG